jgi:hypothetical protein
MTGRRPGDDLVQSSGRNRLMIQQAIAIIRIAPLS